MRNVGFMAGQAVSGKGFPETTATLARRTPRGILHFSIFIFHFALLSATSAPVTKTVMPNGLTLIIKPEASSGIVAIETFVRAGAAQERESNAGIGALVARTLLASTRNKRAETVASVIDEVGGNFQTQWQPDYTEIRAITTTSGFDDATSLLGDILTDATFEQKWVDQVRQETLAEMSTEGDDVFQTTYQQIRRKLYRDNPYNRPPKGYDRVVRALTPADLQAFYDTYYVPNNVVISIVGDVTPAHVLDRFRIAFAGTSAKTLPRERPIPPETVEESKVEVQERSISAAYFMFGFLAPAATDPDYPAAQVASAALGAGKGSRMFQDLREKKQLAYDLGTLYPTMKYQGHMLAYLITDPFRRVSPDYTVSKLLDEVKQAMLDEVTGMQSIPLTPQELERAKRYTIGVNALKKQRLRDRAFRLGWLEAIGLGFDYDAAFDAKVDAVTPEDVQRVAKKYFNNYAMTIVMPKIEEEK